VRETPAVDCIVACVEFAVEEPGDRAVNEGSVLGLGEGGEPVDFRGDGGPVFGCVGDGLGVFFLCVSVYLY
jgi:hypothetical protein